MQKVKDFHGREPFEKNCNGSAICRPISKTLKDEKHSFKKSGTNFYKKRAGGGSKAIYKIYKKTDKLARKSVPKWDGMGWLDETSLRAPPLRAPLCSAYNAIFLGITVEKAIRFEMPSLAGFLKEV